MKSFASPVPSSSRRCPVRGARASTWCLVPLLCLAGPLLAVTTQQVSHRAPSDFARGELDHIMVGEDGSLELSPGVEPVLDLPDPIVWRVAVASDGTRFLATGSDGRVYRVAPGATKAELVADFTEVQVLALAVAADGTAFAGTSPDGRIYRLPVGGTAEPYADPAGRYLWDLRLAPDGSLYVATGEPGAVWRVRGRDQIDRVLETEELHVLSLALDSRHLYAGTAESGYVYQLPLAGGNSDPAVILDAPGDEVKALEVASDGSLLALTLGEAEESDVESPLSGLLARVTTSDTGTEKPRETRIFRLRSGLAPREVWRSSELTGHSLGRSGDLILVGIGGEGKVLSLSPDDEVRFLADCSGEHVTAFASGTDQSTWMAVSNPASLYRLERAPASRGSFTSPVIDSQRFAWWGRLEVRQEEGRGGSVELETRSGNTDKPNATWSAWKAARDQVESPNARYLQYRLTLKPRSGRSPRVREVVLSYLPTNAPPSLEPLVVLDPDVLVERKDDFQSDPVPRGINRPLNPPEAPQLKERAAPGIQAIRWVGSDVDQDRLLYQVELRELGGSVWRPAHGGRLEPSDAPFVNLQATALHDGWYQVRVVASDAVSNLSGQGLTAEQVSVPFAIDHTPPEIHRARVVADGDRIGGQLEARDATTSIRQARYAVDGGDFLPIFPEDRVFDSKSEHLRFLTAPLPPGEHRVVVAVEDTVQNVVTAKFVVSIPGPDGR